MGLEEKVQQQYLSAWAEIDLDQLVQNANIIRKILRKGTGLGAVVKADAYGHGAVEIVGALREHQLISMVIVGKKQEAYEIQTVAGELPILILDRMTMDEVEFREYWIYSAYDIEFLDDLSRRAQREKKEYMVHVRVDLYETGMGIGKECMEEQMNQVFQYPGVKIVGMYTHLYSGYQFVLEQTREELECFRELVNKIPAKNREQMIIHAENSPLIFQFPEYQFDMVRSGTALYGLPFHPDKSYGVKPLLSVKSKVANITRVKGSNLISYRQQQREEHTKGRRKILRFLLGYWDCPFLLTQKKIKVNIKDKLYEIAEEPCMDQSCIEVPENSDIQCGDEITIIGDKPGVTILEILERHHIDLVHSERLCMISKRLPKFYKQGNVRKK